MKRAAKLRLDELLVERGLFENLHDAQASVLAGEVVVGEHRETSAGRRLPADARIRVKASLDFASRGGYKLDRALDDFGLDVAGLTCIDLGASTGGFTDCLLKRGARRVVAVDVGEPLMRWELQRDDRVDYRPSTNVRGLGCAEAGGPFDMAVADLSFIPLERVLVDVCGLLHEGAVFVSLVKPQFEVAKSQVGQRGVVRDRRLHVQAIEKVLQASAAAGLAPFALTYSPITGAKGNVEFLYAAQKGPIDDGRPVRVHKPAGTGTIDSSDIKRVVECAHAVLEVAT